MREMYKWKDKVELSLDNRQIFFLFFGVSVVGCFVFALGLMVGRRIPWDPRGEVEASSEPSLASLADDEEPTELPLTFEHAFDTPAKALTNEDEALADAPAEPAEAAAEPSLPSSSKPTLAASPNATPDVAKGGAPKAASTPAKPAPPKPVSTAAPKAASATLATRQPAPPAAAGPRKFTLQMKAFSKPEEAETFAAKLREHGHAVRVEAHPVNGRVWHRVRVGEYTTWADGLAAKEAFERREGIIAYVVRE